MVLSSVLLLQVSENLSCLQVKALTSNMEYLFSILIRVPRLLSQSTLIEKFNVLSPDFIRIWLSLLSPVYLLCNFTLGSSGAECPLHSPDNSIKSIFWLSAGSDHYSLLLLQSLKCLYVNYTSVSSPGCSSPAPAFPAFFIALRYFQCIVGLRGTGGTFKL